MPARVAPITRSAGSRARGASRRQRYTTTSTATNDTALSANTSAGPDAATSTPPRAGPTARPMFTGNALSVTARVSSDAGTSSDVIACQVGAFIATPTPSANVSARSVVAVIRPTNVSTARSPAATSIQHCVTSSSRRRSTISATAPAGSPTRKTGRLVALCTRATINGDGESDVMAHAALTFCIHVPMLETSEAIHSARNTACDSGVQADSAVVPSPRILQLDVEVRRIMAASAAERIADLEADGFDSGQNARGNLPVRSKLHVHPGPPPGLPGRARNGNVRLDVDRVRRRFTPLQAGGDHQRQLRRRLDGERGLQMDQVRVTRVSGEREVVTVREQRIEGAERLVSGLVIARRGVDLKAEAWRPTNVSDGVAAAAAGGPGADALAPDVTELPHRFEVPIEAVSRACVSDVEVVAPLVAAGVEKLSIVLNEARVVRRQVTGADVLVLDPKASVLETLAREVVERPLIVILDRVTPEPDEAPLALLPVQPQGVVCLPDVRTIANGDEALQVERHLLPAHASLQRAAPERVDVRDERLPEIQRVLVDRRDD